MVERLAELLRRKDFVLDGSGGRLFDIGAPILDRLVQWMCWRNPMRELEFDGRVLGRSGAGREHEPEKNRSAAHQHPAHCFLQ
jgi:hypothetical protein